MSGKGKEPNEGMQLGEVKMGLGGAVGAGLFTGSLVAVAMLLCSILVALPYVGLTSGLAICLSFIIAGVGAGVLQQVWFCFRPALRLSYPARLAGFGVSYLVVLVLCALLGSWLPAGNPGSWVVFAIIYLAIFAVITVAIGHSLKKRGIEYKQRLDDYRAKRDSE